MKKIEFHTLKMPVITLIMGLSFGWLLFGGNSSNSSDPSKHDHATDLASVSSLNQDSRSQHAETTQEEIVWTCSMHPTVRSNESGSCPICGMDLIPLELMAETAESSSKDGVFLSQAAMNLAGVQTSTVMLVDAKKSVRVLGKVMVNEDYRLEQTAHYPGRIERLVINQHGIRIRKGETIAKIYSPELLTAQKELLEANRAKDQLPDLFRATKEKLKNWKLSEEQIQSILEAGRTIDPFTWEAESDGVVMNVHVSEGDHVREGQRVISIADLSSVWVEFDISESDATWLREGDPVYFRHSARPDVEYQATLFVVEPTVDPVGRTIKARAKVDNPGETLFPYMFVSGELEMSYPLQTEWPGIPKSALLWTGKRSIVYVKQGSSEAGVFELREVELAGSTNTHYLIASGIDIGEEVVTNGTFSVDAAAQLSGKSSMMNMSGGRPGTGHEGHQSMQHNHVNTGHDQPREEIQSVIEQVPTISLDSLFNAYFDLQEALTRDDLSASGKAIQSLLPELERLQEGRNTSKGQKTEDPSIADESLQEIMDQLTKINETTRIDQLRALFLILSEEVIALAKTSENFPTPVYIQFCPMANSNKGAVWLSRVKEIQNPYFGPAMYACGSTREILK